MSKRAWITLCLILVTATSVTVPVYSPAVQKLLCSIETIVVSPSADDKTPSPCFGLDRLDSSIEESEARKTFLASTGV